MKRTLSLTIALAAAILPLLVSCAPQAFVVSPEMRTASSSGLNLAGKSIAVVYSVNSNPKDTLFNSSFANGFATRLEEDYFGGDRMVELFTVPAMEGNIPQDTLVKLVLETGKDVVFLIDVPTLGEPVVHSRQTIKGVAVPKDSSLLAIMSIPFSTRLLAYDSMNKEDKMLAFQGSREMKPEVYCAKGADDAKLSALAWKSFAPAAEAVGYQAASSFVSCWKQDYFQVIYYEFGESAWDKGAQHAYNLNWKEAIVQWMTMADSPSPQKKACACYNIALGCFMLGQPDLALEWLARSDAEKPVSLSKNLRAKIKEYTGRE